MSRDRGDEAAPPSGARRAGLSRRNFLRRGTFTAAAVAVASSVPGISTLVATTTADAPAVDTGVSDAVDDSGALAEPLVAHLKDLSTGEYVLTKDNINAEATREKFEPELQAKRKIAVPELKKR